MHRDKYGHVARPMSRTQIEKLAGSMRALLTDPEADLNELQRRRWEGALVALETVLGEKSSLVDNIQIDLQ